MIQQDDAQQRADALIAAAHPIHARTPTAPQHTGMTLRRCLEILASYHTGHFELQDETGTERYDPVSWLNVRPDDAAEWPAELTAPAHVHFTGGAFFDGKRVGTLSVSWIHTVAPALDLLAQTSGLWDFTANLAEQEISGTLELAIIWRA